MEGFKVLVLYFLFFFFIPRFNSQDTISSGKSIRDNQTLISAYKTFEAGFTSIGTSNGLYFGIWYLNISPQTVVWVANRESPIGNSSGVLLNITNGGNLLILDGSGSTIWSSNSTSAAANPVLQLLDSGNLILKDENNSDNIFWQSFDYPGDTFLAGMKLESNMKNGDHISLTSWRSTGDPTPGEYSSYIDVHGYPQQVITKDGTLLYRTGSWNGLLFTGVPWETLSMSFNYSFVLTEQEVYYEYQLLDPSVVTRYTLNPSGLIQRFIWSDQANTWELFSIGPGDQCDNYAFCYKNSDCNSNSSPNCQCLKGFIPKSPEKWNASDWTDGCVRRVSLDCDDRDGFVKYTEVKLPDTSSSWFNETLNLQQCENLCLRNCSCTAYANLDVRDGGSGCLLWFGDIMDLKTKPSEGQDIYIRVAHSELDETKKGRINKKQLAGILVACILLIICMTAVGLALYLRKKKREKPAILGKNNRFDCEDLTESREKEHIDIPTFGLSTIAIATNDFSESYKLGEGGFGPVYKGILENGQEIAVKRLSTNSKQGPEEFKNEVVLIANLQHRNLVKLIGCCIENDERLLIYEFMPNRSLDNFIFDKTRSNVLNWSQRFHIISGIARGLLYLHEDSRLRIIHRDLKTSNILLDKNMNPKISDFGLARIFDADQDEAETKRVVGTYGYMPPEYTQRGHFSVKSDVFSFGVIILEIVSGKRNKDFFDSYHDLDLLGYAWRLWCEEKPLEMMDESMDDTVIPSEILRCIHTGLLCVQNRPEDRPDMSSVVLMLNGEKQLPKPRQPAFYSQEDSSSSKYELWSINEMSISLVDSR